MIVRPFVRFSLALHLLSAGLAAQESLAIIAGTISNPQGAVVPAAVVEVKNLETNVMSKVVSNDRGCTPRRRSIPACTR
jgi:hypothetical protein